MAVPPGSTLRAFVAAAAVALAACSGSSSGPIPPPACKGVDQACGVGAECCSGDCPSGACGCSALAERCGTSADCCDVPGTPRRCEGGACANGPRPIGDVCDWGGQCATLNCDWSGHCAPACVAFGAACTSSQQCCSYMGCPGGTCTYACTTSGGSCSRDEECCSGLGCRAGRCQPGACGTAGHYCAASDDCCTAAMGGKNYFCDAGTGQCDIGRPGSWVGSPPDACATDADCADPYPCRGGYCHWPDGMQLDGGWCLDGQECAGGFCTSTASGVPGTCCSGAGAGCTAGSSGTICCDPLACTGVAGAQSCGACLDFTNSGPQGTAETQCTLDSQCCDDRNLACVGGECCSRRGSACTAGSGETECCAGDGCGSVTTYQGTTENVCCGGFGAGCGYASSCCDGLLCTDGTCLRAPGEPCTGPGQCGGAFIERQDCRMVTPESGVCCSHPDGPCSQDSHCCSGICDEAFGSCRAAPEYGACLTEADCMGPQYNQDWSGQVCGGNAALGASTCCPVPGDTCLSAADCCEAGNACRAPLSGDDTTTPRCCREVGSSASQGYECCTGVAERRSSTSVVYTCCAYPYMTTFTCTSDADCCANTGPGFIGSRCGTASRCCWDPGFYLGVSGDEALCCSGRLDQNGHCR